MPFLIRGNFRFHYKIEHSQNPNAEYLLFIHGAGLDMTSWDILTPLLIDDFHIIKYDIRCHGESNDGDELLSLNLLVDDIYDLISHLKITQFHIIAHGMGSLIGIQFGLISHNMVRSITAISMPIFFSQDSAQKLADHRKNLAMNDSIQAIAHHVLSNVTLLPQNSDIVQKLYKSFHRVNAKKYVEFLFGFLQVHQEIYNNFSMNTHPVLIITGDLDPIYPPYISGMITSYLPNSRYLTVFNSSNMIFLDQPDATAQYIKEFIGEANKKNHKTITSDAFLLDLHNDLKNTIKTVKTKYLQRKLTIHCLNGFNVYLDGQEIENGWNKRFSKEILLYLVFHRSVAKETMCEDLWGLDDIVKSRSNLRVYFSFLRKIFNEDIESHFLSSDNSTIRIMGNIECDLLDYMQNLYQALNEKDMQIKIEMSKSIFLEIKSNFLTISYKDWFLNIRNKIENQLIELAAQLSKYHAEKLDYLKTIEYLKIIIFLKPEDNIVHQEIVEFYYLSHKNNEAEEWDVKRDNTC